MEIWIDGFVPVQRGSSLVLKPVADYIADDVRPLLEEEVREEVRETDTSAMLSAAV